MVAGTSRVHVTLPDGRNPPAGVIGAHPERDLAVLRVGQAGLPVASSMPRRCAWASWSLRLATPMASILQ